MKTIEQRAKDYARMVETDHPDIVAHDYETGAKEEHLLLTEWRGIATDKNGFATNKAWEHLWHRRPVLIKNVRDNTYFVLQEAWQFADWSNEICKSPDNFRWRPIHEAL